MAGDEQGHQPEQHDHNPTAANTASAHHTTTSESGDVTNPEPGSLQPGDPSAVVDTFVPIEYEHVAVYLYGDLQNFCVSFRDQPHYGVSSMGPLQGASAAWTDWQSQMPGDVWEKIHHGYTAIQDLHGVADQVASSAKTAEAAAKVVSDVAGIVEIVCLILVVTSPVALVSKAVDAAAVRTEHVAEEIFRRAEQIAWGTLDVIPALHEMEVTHQVGPTAEQVLATVHSNLEWLLHEAQNILESALHV